MQHIDPVRQIAMAFAAVGLYALINVVIMVWMGLLSMRRP